MPRKFIKRHIPDAHQLHKRCSFMGVLGEHLHRPSLWHLNRRSVAKAFAIGLFCTWLPIPFQTVVAAFFAIVFCANLPLSVVLVFISNPLTMPAMFYFAYRLGSILLGSIPEPMSFSLSIEWISNMIGSSWRPILLGSLVLGIISSVLGYIAVRVLWRLHIIQRWQNRKNHHPR
ncbi:MAG: DUF2062 domain-containing protein [Thiotrichaceae bacterium]